MTRFVLTMLTQPVAAKEMASTLVEAAEAGPQGRMPDLGAPKAEQLKSLVAAYLPGRIRKSASFR